MSGEEVSGEETRAQMVQRYTRPTRYPETAVQNAELHVIDPVGQFLALTLAGLVNKSNVIQRHEQYGRIFSFLQSPSTPTGVTQEEADRIMAELPIMSNNSLRDPDRTFIQFRRTHFTDDDVRTILRTMRETLGDDAVRMARNSDFSSGRAPSGDIVISVRDTALGEFGSRLAVRRGEELLQRHPQLLSYLDRDLANLTPDQISEIEVQIAYNLGVRRAELLTDGNVPRLLLTGRQGDHYSLVGADRPDGVTPDIHQLTQQIGRLTPPSTPVQNTAATPGVRQP